MNLKPLPGKLFCVSLEIGLRTSAGGIVLTDDNVLSAGERGVRPRWFQVVNVNSKTNSDDIKIGDYVLVEHGRWSKRFSGTDIDNYSIVEEKSVMMVSEDPPIV
jgi:co-chaperonin GroES (HSP10)